MAKLFKVVTKAAIYNPDKSKVLIIDIYFDNDYGLPGGHIEENESVDDAMHRELFEECGIEIDSLQKVDFFFHSNGKVVLAYVGIADSEEVKSQQNDYEGIPKWLTMEEFKNIDIEPNYRKLVVDHWT